MRLGLRRPFDGRDNAALALMTAPARMMTGRRRWGYIVLLLEYTRHSLSGSPTVDCGKSMGIP